MTRVPCRSNDGGSNALKLLSKTTSALFIGRLSALSLARKDTTLLAQRPPVSCHWFVTVHVYHLTPMDRRVEQGPKRQWPNTAFHRGIHKV